MEDPGRLPYRQLMNETQRQTREAEARAALKARIHEGDEARPKSPRGVRGVLLRVRNALGRKR